MKHLPLLAAGLLLLAFLALSRPLYRAWGERRATALAAAFLEQTNFANAALAARRALQFNSNSVAACQVLAALYEQNGSPQAIHWRQRAATLEPGSDAHRLALARTALQFDHIQLGRETLATVSSEGRRTNAGFHELAAQVAVLQRDLAAADFHLEQASSLDGTRGVHSINRQILRLHAPDSNIVQAARQALDPHRRHPAHGTAILRALTREAVGRDDLERAQRLSADLQQRTDAQIDDRLLHLGILHKAGGPASGASSGRRVSTNSPARPPISPAMADFIRTTQDEASRSPEAVCALANWLSTHDLAEAALPWLETLSGDVRNATCVRLVETQCHLVLKSWAQLGGWLQQANWAADEHLRHALLALVYRQQGDEQLATLEWKRAVRACQNGGEPVPKSQQALVRLAGAWSWENEAESLLWEIAAGSETRWALALLQKAYELAGDTRSLLRVFRASLTRDPEDLIARNNLAAASLLLRTNLNSAHQFARDVYQAQPTNAAVVCTYAYSLHLLGRTGEAIQLLADLPAEQMRQPGPAAYYGLLLASQGIAGKAAQYLSLARTGQLLPEEKELVAEGEALLRQPGSAAPPTVNSPKEPF